MQYFCRLVIKKNPGRFDRGSFRPGSFRPYFRGESIRPILVGRFGRGSFGPVLILVQNPLILHSICLK